MSCGLTLCASAISPTLSLAIGSTIEDGCAINTRRFAKVGSKTQSNGTLQKENTSLQNEQQANHNYFHI
jgi:hypothetical protein